jgi:hypothetical protein
MILKDLRDSSIFFSNIDNNSIENAIDEIELSLPYCGKLISLNILILMIFL